MAFPVRCCMLCVKRYILIYVVLIITFIFVLSSLMYMWSELYIKLDCLLKDNNFEAVTTHTQNGMKTDISEINRGVKFDKFVQVTRNQVINKSELRLKWLQRKVERISQKMNKSQPINLLKLSAHSSASPNYNVHIFYYAWYGNLLVDGQWKHWNQQYLPNWKKEDKRVYPSGHHNPPPDISSNFYPALGCYSSRDPAVVHKHMKQLRDANIGKLLEERMCVSSNKYTLIILNVLGVLVVSWYPPGFSDTDDESSDTVMPLILDTAVQYDLKVAPHIEPYRNRNPINLSTHLQYIVSRYGKHPALYKIQHKGKVLPVYYIYDSYLTPPSAWKELLSDKGNISVRGTQLDGIFLGLLVEMQHRYDIKKAHFDGFYTYFATNGFSYGSSWKNWRSLSKYAVQNGLLFVPSVGPGYVDTQIRPWNVANTRHRRHGKYYEVAWRSALATRPRLISITSFNEWHEGTQIEPAVPKSIPSFTYLDYEPEGPYLYLNLTKWWLNEFIAKLK